MPIYFFDFLDGAGWDPIHFDSSDVNNYFWSDGYPQGLGTAPFDFTATLDGALWASTKVEASFNWRGRRVKGNYTVPTRHHNMRQLMIVVDGTVSVEYGEKGDVTQKVGPSEFWVAEAAVPYSMTSGPDGVIYLECWDGPMSTIETYWHNDKNWVRR